MSEVISIPKEEFMKMKLELEALRNTKLYKRLLEFEENIKSGKKYTRADLGF
jgi:PHD/YefM family antitoxin component YafN of YafNO toxin-antitoxin module